MASTNLRAGTAPDNNPYNTDWDTAWARYSAIHAEWDRMFHEADHLPPCSPRRVPANEASKGFIVYAQFQRHMFLTVPAPTLEALVHKMRVADAVDDQHHHLCLVDLCNLIGVEPPSEEDA